MWKGVFKSRLGKASLFQAPSKMWNGVFINARQIKSVPSTLKTLGFTVPTRMNLIKVHMTAMDSTKFQKGKNMAEKVNPVKVSLVDGTEFQSKNMADKEGISKLGEDLYRRPVSYETRLARFSLPVEESEKGKKVSQITNQLEAKICLEEKLLKLMEEFTKLEKELRKLEAMEADHSEHEHGRKKMELLARLETLYNEAKSSEFSAQSCWEGFLVSVNLLRFEFKLKRRPSCGTQTTDPLGEIPWDKIPENSDKFLELNRLREAYPKVSQIQASLAEFWKSSSYPVKTEYFLDEDLYEEQERLADELIRLLISVIQEYPVDVEEMASDSPSPEPGKYFDIVELLSRFPGDLIQNNGERVALNTDTFKGKYVLVCCFHVPVLPSTSYVQSLMNLCNELYSTRDDFEMVMVARMNGLANDEEVFHHFFSGFPKSCLAVPFEENQRRDYLCKVLGLSLHCHDCIEWLLLNAEGIVLPRMNSQIFSEFGAEGFPFTNDILYKREMEHKVIIFEKEGNWLGRVLRCNDSSPVSVYRFNPSGGPREEVPIAKLGDRHVGLYLCSDGEMLPEILEMHGQCREKQLDFEVVVVYMPFAYKTNPKIFEEKIDRLLKKHNICDWWCLPFNNSVSLRLCRIAQNYDPGSWGAEDYTECDKLIVVGPGVDHLDVYGDCVMLNEGIDAFPFTVDAAIKARGQKLKEITLESLFVDDEVSVFRGNNSSDSRKLGQLLRGKKNIILCIDSLYLPGRGGSDFKTLASIYNQTKAVEKEDFEMVFVARPDLEAEYGNRRDIPSHEMPWFICPITALNSTKLEELMSLLGGWTGAYYRDVLVGFGEDGRVCSCKIIEVTYKAEQTSPQFSLVDTLYDDMEVVMGYHKYVDHGMLSFANPNPRQV